MKTLRIALPDWMPLDTVLKSPLPFALWPIGDQPLLYHWLDYAVNQDCESIIIYAMDRPAAIRQALTEATLWPIEWKLQAVDNYDSLEVDCWAHHLPELPVEEGLPKEGWGLLRYWLHLQKQWLNHTFAHTNALQAEMLSIGRFCSIHPTATLHQPVFMGDYVQIGPGCSVGPYAVLGEGAVLAGPSHVEQSIIAPHTFLAGHTELKSCYLDGSRLFQLKHGIELPSIDSFIAGKLKVCPKSQKPPWKERLRALGLWVKTHLAHWNAKPILCQDFINHQGLRLRTYKGGNLLWARKDWLWHVVKGEMRLIGILPRTEQDLKQLSLDWQHILRDAPVGVMSYADCHPSEDEALHAVYQATQPRVLMEDCIRKKWSN
jgi:hypothetical protein